jgi:lipoprotein
LAEVKRIRSGLSLAISSIVYAPSASFTVASTGCGKASFIHSSSRTLGNTMTGVAPIEAMYSAS